MPRAKNNAEVKICDAALKLAAHKGWRTLTLDEILRSAKVPKTQTTIHDKKQILPALVQCIDEPS